MSRDKVLRPKLTIKSLCEYLDIPFMERHQILCEHVNAKDFRLYYTNGSIVKNIEYTAPASIFMETKEEAKSDLPSYKADGNYYDEADFYAVRNEITAFIKSNIYADTLDKNKLGVQEIDDSFDQATPHYLDPTSEHYAPELDLAIKLHKAIQLDGYGTQYPNRKDKVSKWLDEYKPDLSRSDALDDRLSTIIAIKIK